MIEDLKDMLTEKSELLNDILAKKLKIEKETKANINTQLISHVTDIFKELKEHQHPYCYTQSFNEELEKTVKNPDLIKERRYLREKGDENLWQIIIYEELQKGSKKLQTINIEAKSVFSDVDDLY